MSAAIAASRATGMVREMIMARLFGAGAAYDAFLLGMRIPNLTRNLFAEGALSSAFVPIFTRSMTAAGKRDAAELSNQVATALLIAVGAVCALGMVASPLLVSVLAPGFSHVAGKSALAVLLTRIMFPFLVLVALAAQAMGVLNACGRFGVPAMASTFFNLGSVAVGLALGYTVGRHFEQGPIVSMAWGVVAGGALQLAWQLPSLGRAGFAFRPDFRFSHPGLREIALLMLPALVGNAAMQINVTVNTNLASSLTDAAGHVMDGPVSWLSYAFRFLQFPLGLFGAAITSATLPEVSRAAALGRMEDFRDALARSLGTAMLFTIPASVGLAVLGESMIGAIYQWGRFTAADTRQTALALACYAVGLVGYSATKILAPAFYALSDARTPMWIALGSIAVNLGAALALVKGTAMGHAGLALSTSIVALGGAAALFWLLRTRLGGLSGRALALSAVKITIASLAMGAVCVASSHAVRVVIAPGKARQLADLAISIPLGATIFYIVARQLRAREVESIQSAVLHFLKECSPT